MDPTQIPLVAAIADDLPVGIWVARAPDGEFVYSNRAFAEIMGTAGRADVARGEYAEPYGIYTREGQLYPESRMPFVRALQERTTVVADDICIHRGDGRRLPVRAFAKPLFDEGGVLAFVAIAFFDATTEVEANRARLEAQERLRTVVDHAPIIFFAFDNEGVLTLSEGRGLASIGLKPGELVGRSIFDIYRDEAQVLANTRRALAGEEFYAKTQVGPFTFESSFGPLRNAAGEVVGALGVSTNVTERERMQAQLIQADRMASLGTLAASVAHEVNTPLAYVGASLDHLARELPKWGRGECPDSVGLESLVKLVEEARQGIESVKTIARDLNAFSRPHERQEPLDVRSVLDSALRMTSNETMHRCRVVRDYEDVPMVNANEARLAQVFLNLLTNAAHALPVGEASRNEIRVVTRAEGAKVQVEISDSGPGIDEAILPLIFDPFFTTKPVGQGTGLGLAICRDILRSLGAEITVESRPGRGTTFRVNLPCAPELLGGQVSAPVAELENRPRVLIVDDHVSLRKVLSITLRSACELDLVHSGKEALHRLLGASQYDVVLCDLMMPDMSGMEVFEKIRTERPGLEQALCFMTGGAFSPRAREFLATVSNPCFEKPFDFVEVIGRILRDRAAVQAG